MVRKGAPWSQEESEEVRMHQEESGGLKRSLRRPVTAFDSVLYIGMFATIHTEI